MRRAGWVVMGAMVLSAAVVGASAEPAGSLSPAALKTLRRLAIQHNGRHKPFDSFARETLWQITGSRTFRGDDPVQTVWSIIASPEEWQDQPLIAIPFGPLREALGLDRRAARVSYNELVATRALMRALPPIVAKQSRDEKLTMLEQETLDAFERFVAFSQLIEHRLELVPPPPGLEQIWVPILLGPTLAESGTGHAPERWQALRAAWTTLITALREGQPQAVDAAAQQLSRELHEANPAAYPARWRLDVEVFYNQAAPFRWARLAYLMAVLGLLAGLLRNGWWTRAGLIACGTGFLLHGAGILTRVILGGRPPVSNFYETMLWLPFVGVLLALVFEQVYRARYFALGASILAALTLFLADQVPLDSSIAPVVAVLRSNLWLTIHVLTIVASYGALALATVLAHLYGVLRLAGRKPKALEPLDLFLYRTLQVGVVLLAGGIMLGAVWANASWGRYWGWDPKETWALITLLWFLAILHGRFAGWLRGVGVALSTIGGFFLLLMTYYGVSFYLVGLHSYAGGHAKPLPPLLVGYLVLEIAFLLIVGAAALRNRRAA